MKSRFTSDEKKAMLGLSGVLAARMLGFSLILPMFSNYSTRVLHATPIEAGLAFGVYGLSQALLQIPFGALSDRIGRKTTVAFGLVIFIVGSVVAALSTTIVGLTIGYFLQGAAAIASTILAWMTDAIDVSRRNVGMAVIGMSIGASFVIGLPLASVVFAHYGGPAVFWICVALGTIALVLVLFALHEPASHQYREIDEGTSLASLVSNRDLAILSAGGALVYLTMRAIFFVVPLQMQVLGISQGKLYMCCGIVGALVMGSGSRQSDKGRARVFIFLSFALTLIGYLMLWHFGTEATPYAVGYGVWFAGFSVLQALLPGAVSKIARPGARGTTLGFFNTCQYIGAAFGGPLGGRLAGVPTELYLVLVAMTALVMVGVMALRQVDRIGTVASDEAVNGSPSKAVS